MLSKLNLKEKIKINRLWIRASLIFLFFFLLFLSAHFSHSGFTSADDPYYHAKHALLIEQSGRFNLVEPWLEFSFQNYAPVDLWWGYHLTAARFIDWFGPVLGVKIFSSFLAALAFLILYLILNDLKIKYPAVWTFLLFFSSSTLGYRLLLERPHLLSLIFLPLAFWLLIRKKWRWLFFVSLFFILFYHLAPVIILPALIYTAVGAYYERRLNLKPLIAAAGGVLAGIFIHPDSLNYLYIIYVVSFKIFFLKFSGVDLGIGNELQLHGFIDFLQSNFLGLTVFILAAVVYLSIKQTAANQQVNGFLFCYAGLWFIATLLIPRAVEFWLPAVFFFAVMIFRDFIKNQDFADIKSWLKGKINFKIAGLSLVIVLAIIIFYNLNKVFNNLFNNNTVEISANFQEVNNWLKANTAKDSMVFYDRWDMWPMMFYYNDYNHYITGMDPTFLYESDARIYWLWRNLDYYGLACDQPGPCLKLSPREQLLSVPWAIKSVFRSKYAVLENYENSNLIKTLKSLKTGAKLVFKNSSLVVYEMK